MGTRGFGGIRMQMVSARSRWKEMVSWRPPRRISAGVGSGLRIGHRSASADYVNGTNELPVQLALADVLRPGDVFIDIGANVGFFSMLAARLVGRSGEVFALEPVPDNVAAVRANARRNRFGNVTVLRLAASDSNGRAALVTTKHPGGAVLASADSPPDPVGEIEVETATVDSLIATGRVEPPDLVKIDVEGAEPAVLAGMMSTLARHQPVVVIEVDGPDEDVLAERRRAVTRLFADVGYESYELQASYSGREWCVAHLVARPRIQSRDRSSVDPGSASLLADDVFTDDRAPGTVVGSIGPSGARRIGTDVEGSIGIDNGALRIQPLSNPGWGREGLAYGPFAGQSGLAFGAHVLNGHNASQTYYFPEPPRARLRRWLSEARRGRFRRSHHYENLAVGLFGSAVSANPLVDSHTFVMHAATEDNGELWASNAGGHVRLVRGVLNVPIIFVVALRADGGAAYYTSSLPGATGASAYPMLRPLCITAGPPDAQQQPWYAAIQQRILGEVGYRVDTRVYRTRVALLPEWSSWWGSAHLADDLIGYGELVGSTAATGSAWRELRVASPVRCRGGTRCVEGASSSGASLPSESPVGLVRIVAESAGAGVVELCWRLDDDGSGSAVRLDHDGCTIVEISASGSERVMAVDRSRSLTPSAPTVVQVVDSGRCIGVHVDGQLVGDQWFDGLVGESHDVGFIISGDAIVRGFEAHPAEIAVPEVLDTGAPWLPPPSRLVFDERFDLVADDLAGTATPSGGRTWERSFGPGGIVLEGEGRARVRASRDEPNPDRTIFTVEWEDPTFADVSVEMTMPGNARGEGENGRVGIVFWQDQDNYVIDNFYVADDFAGASISTFYHLDGYENMYDAVWTLVQGVDFGKRCVLRASFDGHRFLSWSNGEPALVRALTDVYPSAAPLRIERVGIIVNEEWGNDTGTVIHRFTASGRAES